MPLGERYLPATALGGRLYVEAVSSKGPCDDKRLPLQDEAVVDLLANPRIGHRKVRTVEELAEVIRVF